MRARSGFKKAGEETKADRKEVKLQESVGGDGDYEGEGVQERANVERPIWIISSALMNDGWAEHHHPPENHEDKWRQLEKQRSIRSHASSWKPVPCGWLLHVYHTRCPLVRCLRSISSLTVFSLLFACVTHFQRFSAYCFIWMHALGLFWGHLRRDKLDPTVWRSSSFFFYILYQGCLRKTGTKTQASKRMRQDNAKAYSLIACTQSHSFPFS